MISIKESEKHKYHDAENQRQTPVEMFKYLIHKCSMYFSSDLKSPDFIVSRYNKVSYFRKLQH